LRGEATRPSALGRKTVEVEVGGVSLALVLLAMAYGACMGCFAVLGPVRPSYWQVVAATLKVPALFFLTLIVTFPSLYVFNALVGSRLEPGPLLRLLLASIAVMVTVLASLGPIVAFFSVSTTTYAFMVLVNVAAFGVSGLLGILFLLRTLQRLSLAPSGPEPGEKSESGEIAGQGGAAVEPPSALDPLEGRIMARNVKTVFRCWVVLFGLVGAQMSWVLRPFSRNARCVRDRPPHRPPSAGRRHRCGSWPVSYSIRPTSGRRSPSGGRPGCIHDPRTTRGWLCVPRGGGHRGRSASS
jgi:hypothetical protein